MKYFTLFHPDTISPELEAQFRELTTVGNLDLVYLLDGRWVLVPGVIWPDATQAESKTVGETEEKYRVRMEPDIQKLFDAGLPNGLAINLNQLNMIQESDQWRAIEAAIP